MDFTPADQRDVSTRRAEAFVCIAQGGRSRGQPHSTYHALAGGDAYTAVESYSEENPFTHFTPRGSSMYLSFSPQTRLEVVHFLRTIQESRSMRVVASLFPCRSM